jgi:hypothetical protein
MVGMARPYEPEGIGNSKQSLRLDFGSKEDIEVMEAARRKYRHA